MSKLTPSEIKRYTSIAENMIRLTVELGHRVYENGPWEDFKDLLREFQDEVRACNDLEHQEQLTEIFRTIFEQHTKDDLT